MWSHFDDAKTSHADAFITDCKHRARCSGMPPNTALQQSSRGSTRHDTSDWKTVLGIELRMPCSRRKAAKRGLHDVRSHRNVSVIVIPKDTDHKGWRG